MTPSSVMDVEERARQSQGGSSDPIYQMVAKSIAQRNSGGVLVDVGCGSGRLWEHLTCAMSVNTYNNKRKQEK